MPFQKSSKYFDRYLKPTENMNVPYDLKILNVNAAGSLEFSQRKLHSNCNYICR